MFAPECIYTIERVFALVDISNSWFSFSECSHVFVDDLYKHGGDLRQ